jgi:hypothetical protein
VHEPGRDDLLLAGGAGDRTGCGIVLAGLHGGIPFRVVAELTTESRKLRQIHFR